MYVLLFYSQFIDVSVLDGGWSERPEQMARAKRYRLLITFRDCTRTGTGSVLGRNSVASVQSWNIFCSGAEPCKVLSL